MSEDVEQRPAKRQRFFTDTPSSPLPTEPRDADASVPYCPEYEENRTDRGTALEIPPPERTLKSSTDLKNERDPPHRRIRTTESLGLPIADATHASSLHQNGDLQIDEEGTNDATISALANGFDVDLFTSIVGEQLPADAIKTIQSAASNNLERAVNIYFDGSWKKPVRINGSAPARSRKLALREQPSPETTVENESVLRNQPPARYVGAFGVGGWATRSGLGFLKHGDPVNIERERSQPTMKRGRGGKAFANNKSDVLTRFTNTSGQEIGRLPHETAEWVSTLIDQKICRFEGVCVFVPDRVRVNDTIYLQLRVYLRKEAFQSGALAALNKNDNRSTGLFEEKESTEEKNLRLRQVGLVKLFHEISLHPTSTNPTTEKHKRDGILRAAEIAEQYDSTKKENRPKSNKDSNDSSGEDDGEELEEDQLDTLYQKAQSFDFNMPAADPAPSFILDLRKYQQQALHWMLSKEKDSKQTREKSMHPLWEEYTWPIKDVDDKDLPKVKNIDRFYVNPYSGDLSVDFPAQEQHCRGGILADEMGLGKTIEMLSLVHSHRFEPDPRVSNGLNSVNDLARMPNSSGVVPAPYTTLVVAPTSLISQWESEALKAGTLRVLVYYGSDKAVNLRELCCESKYATAPQVIVTSYGVVLSEFRQLALQSALGPSTNDGLFSVEFFRIILDEAHVIKNRRSKSARSCYELKAAHRWALTGTPIVNRLEDLFSLVRFLKVEPWSNFSFWKTFITVPFESKEYVRALNVVQSVLEPLVLRRTKSMKTPEGEPLVPLPKKTVTIEEVELPKQEREIYDYIFTRAKRTYNDNVVAGTLLQSYSTIFAQILRLRQTCCHPIMTRNKAIVAEEESAAVAADAANEFKDDMDLQELINQFTAENANANANSQDTSGTMIKFTTHALRQIQTESSGECPICCEEPMIDPAVTACWHSACKKCLEDFLQHQMNKGVEARCFNCRAPVDAKNTFEVVRHPSATSISFADDTMSGPPPTSSQPAPRISLRRIYPLSPSAHTSAKIHALINHLGRIPPNTKSVVFSQFTSFLDLIGPQLSRVGISHLRLDGSMPQKARAAVLAEFTKADSFTDDEIVDLKDDTPGTSGPAKTTAPSPSKSAPTVLLISLRAGGVGLNLTTASNVFLMDPWWSFAIEAQAIDRVHRMGQIRDVHVTRFVVKDSIEGRMLRVQERKMNIAGSLGLKIGGDDGEADKGKNRLEELKMLFE
ncbi:DNA repair protein rad5 [Penicillium digitatum]|uniref:DNA repair protein rad5 n=2 Tax=Penicillium digitatum TaxID=36651 RepID=K9FBZ4_PEND1|nr:DNA repair protein rad5 [Penicillium digitatum Pd1]EKV05622.1 DNA repair protein rad5 [Penicillium digitatum Pd1]QQK40396.1 DNA repair protein rad5 [Penicillium digitatum]